MSPSGPGREKTPSSGTPLSGTVKKSERLRGKLMADETEKWANVVKFAGAKAECSASPVRVMNRLATFSRARPQCP